MDQLPEPNTAEMAAILGIHPRTLQKLQKDGWIEGRIAHDCWDIRKTVQHYLNHIHLTRISGKP